MRSRPDGYFYLSLSFVRVKLLDECKLVESGVQDGSTISLIMLPPFELYVQGTDQRMHTVVVPSSEPEVGAIGLSRHLVLRKVIPGCVNSAVNVFSTELRASVNCCARSC